MKKSISLLFTIILLIGSCTVYGERNSSAPAVTTVTTSIGTMPCYSDDKAIYAQLDLPEYILSIWPVPGCVMSLEQYTQSLNNPPTARGIGVDLLWMNIDKLSPNMEIPQVSERISLFIDGSIVLTDTMQTFNTLVGFSAYDENGRLFTVEESPEIITWGPTLNPGKHTVEVIVKNNIGEVYEYTWSFSLTEP